MAVSTSSPAVALARSALYDVLAEGFTSPDAQRLKALLSQETDATVREALASLPESHEPQALLSDWGAVRAALARFAPLDYEAEFLRLFEVGIPRAPCPLYESAYGKQDQRREVMGELVRFYRHFGLTLGEKAREMPDHLRVEFEFMHFLTYAEAHACDEGSATNGLRRAQHDLLARHLTRWTPQLWERVRGCDAPAFEAWAGFAQRFLETERGHVREMPFETRTDDGGQGRN